MTWWNVMPESERTRWAARAGGTGVAADAWRLYNSMQYRLDQPKLQLAVDSASPTPKHAALLKAIRAVAGFEEAKLVRIESGTSSLVQRKVVSAAGEIIHDDHQKWLASELEADGGRVSATRTRLAALDLRLSRCALTTLNLVVDRAGDQANFMQATVHLLSEAIDRRLFDPYGGWSTPRDPRELVDDAEQGAEVAEVDQKAIGTDHYELKEVIDMAAFVKAAQIIHRERVTEGSRRRFDVIEDDGTRQTKKVMTGAEIDPAWHLYPCKEHRYFGDWTTSSAGRSGARACDHWTFRVSDWTDAKDGERYLSFVPQWNLTRKLAKLERCPPSDYELFGKLEAMDRRVGVPFAWYFYMLHGNRVRDWAGKAVLRAAEAGRIVLPEHDYQVLRHWQARGYGF